ncbi:hypothetical protein [Streptomyces sp. NPDC046988]
MGTYKITYMQMADTAPLLGFTMPVRLREPADYVGVPRPRVEQAA